MRCMWTQTYAQAQGGKPCTRAATHATLTATGHVVAGLCSSHHGALKAARKRAGNPPVKSARIIQENPR